MVIKLSGPVKQLGGGRIGAFQPPHDARRKKNADFDIISSTSACRESPSTWKSILWRPVVWRRRGEQEGGVFAFPNASRPMPLPWMAPSTGRPSPATTHESSTAIFPLSDLGVAPRLRVVGLASYPIRPFHQCPPRRSPRLCHARRLGTSAYLLLTGWGSQT